MSSESSPSTYTHKHSQPSRSSGTQIMQINTREDTRFIPWFSSSPRLAYVNVVEEATKVWALQPLSSFSNQESELLKWGWLHYMIGMITNFPLLTTSTGAHWATPSHLGGFTSKSNKCAMKIDEARQVLKVRITLICSLALNHTTPTLNHALSTLFSQKRGLGRAHTRLWKGFGRSGASAARPGGRGMGIYTHLT
jgi:hypothetical protein